jgi:hypothetical protein
MLTFAMLVFNMLINRIYTILLFVLLSLSIRSQDVQGPYFVFTTLKDQAVSKTFANYPHFKIIVFDPAAHGTFSIDSSKRYAPVITYQPDSNFLGRDTISYEYQDANGKLNYFSFIFIVVNSTISVGRDNYSVVKNSDSLDIYPLSNDISSINNNSQYLKIQSINLVNLISTKLHNDTTIRIKPKLDSTGIAYINYTICDTFNTCVDANIVIYVVDTSNVASDTFYLNTAKNTSFSVPLNQSGFSTSKNPKKGYLDYDTDYSVIYSPQKGFYGLDTFVVSKNNISRTVFVEVYFVKDPGKIVVDDIVFTPKDSVIEFNVGTNDIVKKFSFLIDQKPPKGKLDLLNSGTGEFRYQPESGYEGIQTFTYKVCPQGKCEYGQVRIFIGNWQPDTRAQYKFSTFRNVPLVFSYVIPVDAYNFSAEVKDSVKFYPGYDTIYLNYKGCKDTVIGYNQLIYYPPKDFIGTKSFKINYCIPSTGQCVTANCKVEIKYSDNKDCSILCAGDCVWPGDVNQDGHVTLLDFLEIGYNLGKSGQSRDSLNKNPSVFKALRSKNWDSQLPGGFANLKNADADGNGKVDYLDTIYVSNFYRQQHSLVPKPVYDRGDFPFILNVLTPNVKIGEVAAIEVQLGDATYPVINLGGFSYELDYNTNVVNETSLAVYFYKQGWTTLNSSLMNMYKKPWDVRSNGNKISGKGGVEVITFIVEDDLGGFRKDNQLIKIPFYFQNILCKDSEGNFLKLDDQVAYINIDYTDSPPILNPNALVVFPNPAAEQLNVQLYGNNDIINMQLFTIAGNLIKTFSNSHQKSQQIDVQNVTNGLYLLRVETSLGPIIRKIEIFR